MKFAVCANNSGAIYVQLNSISCLLFIAPYGVQLRSTIFKQREVDYDSNDRPKIVGVDLI